MVVTNEAEVVEAVRDARESRRTLEIVGAGTKRAFGRPTHCDDILDVSGLRGIVTYEPEELLLTVLPGTPVTEINELLAANGQRLGFDPGDWGPLLGARANSGTIGGAISADVCGPAAVRYGRARDQLLGYRAVNGFGEAYKAGGKVVKNVTGFDLPKLMCGAMGTLGALTELTFRVFPLGERCEFFSVHRIGAVEGYAMLRRAWSSPVAATALCYQKGGPSEIVKNISLGSVHIRLEGAQADLDEKSRLLQLCAAPHELLPGDEAAIRVIGSGENLADGLEDVWRVTMPQAFAQGCPSSLGDWAGGLHWMKTTPGVDPRPSLAWSQGSATLVRASAETRKRAQVFPPEEPARAALTRAVKAAFDPLGIFNPGRMYKDI